MIGFHVLSRTPDGCLQRALSQLKYTCTMEGSVRQKTWLTSCPCWLHKIDAFSIQINGLQKQQHRNASWLNMIYLFAALNSKKYFLLLPKHIPWLVVLSLWIYYPVWTKDNVWRIWINGLDFISVLNLIAYSVDWQTKHRGYHRNSCSYTGTQWKILIFAICSSV